jgi:hypothetical protein
MLVTALFRNKYKILFSAYNGIENHPAGDLAEHTGWLRNQGMTYLITEMFGST